MKNVIKFLLSFVFVASIMSCGDAYEVNYQAPVTINIEGANDGIALLGKGVDNYTAKISVKAPAGINFFEIYNANIRTGVKEAIIEETQNVFETPATDYSYEYTFSGLADNSCIRISVTDTDGKVFEKNLLVQITPAVLFSESLVMEAADDYYGSYYATWLTGRVYLKSNGGDYAKEIDLSMGMVNLGGETVPALISPAKRSEHNLPTLPGLKDTQFLLTGLTVNAYNQVSKVEAQAISSLPDPTLSSIEVESGKVYLFKTADGKKGLIAITALNRRTGTIEDVNGEWVKDYVYWRASFTTKTLAE